MKWMTTNAPKAVAWSCGKEKATGSSAKPFMWHTKDGPQGDRCSLDLHLELLRLERVGTMLDLGDTEPPWQLHVSQATKATMSAYAHRWFDPASTAAPALDENELAEDDLENQHPDDDIDGWHTTQVSHLSTAACAHRLLCLQAQANAMTYLLAVTLPVACQPQPVLLASCVRVCDRRVHVCACVRVCACACVRVCARARAPPGVSTGADRQRSHESGTARSRCHLRHLH